MTFLRNEYHLLTKLWGTTRQWAAFNNPETTKMGTSAGTRLGEAPCSQPGGHAQVPSHSFLALWTTIAVVLKWHIQINSFDKWKEAWDMSGHGDDSVVSLFINHLCFSKDNARLTHGCLWFRWQGWEQITLLLRTLVRQIASLPIGTEMIRVLQKWNKNITIHLCGCLIPEIIIWCQEKTGTEITLKLRIG